MAVRGVLPVLCFCFLFTGTVWIASVPVHGESAALIRLGPVVESSLGMVVAAHPEAAAAGAEILANGGNATDAAIATAFALAVVEPEASGLGGGGFLLSYDAETRSCISIDYRETAPVSSTEAMFAVAGPGMPEIWHGPTTHGAQATLQRYGGQAVGVPHAVAGLLRAHDLGGRLPIADVLGPSIRLAEDGFTVSQTLYNAVLNIYDVLLSDDAMAAAFLNDYLPYEPGEIMRRPDLAETLRRIAAGGADAFYRGEIATDIVNAVRTAGGILSADDMASVRVTLSAPLEIAYRSLRLLAPPLPAGGLPVFETLAILDGYDLGPSAISAADRLHLVAEATKRVFADRREYVGDPAFVDVPTEILLSRAWTAARRATIDPAQAVLFPEPGLLESSSTTHVSVVDADGNAVSLTQSIGLFFGARVFVPEWGILMNNTMADFDPEPGAANSIAPGKAPASSMSPLLLFEKDSLRAILGSPGGTRITSTLVQLIVEFADLGRALSDAVDSPRIHAETGTLSVESRLAEDIVASLEARGHPLDIRGAYDLYFGGAHLIEIIANENEKAYIGVADPRRAGRAAGL